MHQKYADYQDVQENEEETKVNEMKRGQDYILTVNELANTVVILCLCQLQSHAATLTSQH